MKIKFKIFLFILVGTLLVTTSIFSNQEKENTISETVSKPHKPPILTTAAIIEVYDNDNNFLGIVLIERGKAPWGKALPGGKVEYGETVEDAIRREMMEEVNLELFDLKQFHVYSDPTRDFRHHSVEVTHFAKAYKLPKAGDDAAKAFVVKLENIPWDLLAFDHAKILKDYIEWKNGNTMLSLINLDSYDVVKEYFETFTSLSREEKWNDLLNKGQKALAVCREKSLKKEEAKICAQLTSTSYYQGNYDLALQYANKCHDLSKEFTDPSLFLHSLYLESAVYRALAGKNQNDDLQQVYYAKAVKIAEDALAIFESKKLECDLLKGKIYFNLGAAHADNPKGNLQLATKNYFLALESFEKIKNIEDQVRTNIRLGKVYLLQNDYQNTQMMIDKMRPLATSTRVLMQIDYLEAQLKFATNQFSEAEKICQKGNRKSSVAWCTRR